MIFRRYITSESFNIAWLLNLFLSVFSFSYVSSNYILLKKIVVQETEHAWKCDLEILYCLHLSTL